MYASNRNLELIARRAVDVDKEGDVLYNRRIMYQGKHPKGAKALIKASLLPLIFVFLL